VEHSTVGVELWERSIPGLETLTLLKAVGVIEGATPADILAFTLEGDLAKRKEFDPDISLLEIVKPVTPTIQVTRTHVIAPYPGLYGCVCVCVCGCGCDTNNGTTVNHWAPFHMLCAFAATHTIK
jgi:hypothetical protein